jgi:hypothetical protein
MSQSLTDRLAFGRMTFRLFVNPAQRALIQPPAHGAMVRELDFPGPVNGAAAESLRLSGVWPTPAPDLPQLRPIFPGALRFIALPGAALPRPQDIEVVGGHVTDRALDAAAISGRIMVRVQSAAALRDLRRLGSLPYLFEAPTHAWYGPVTLTRDFLRRALLDWDYGLNAAGLYPGGGIVRTDPGAPGWEALALSAFLAGQYEPLLLAGDTPDHDDAVRLPMPQLIVAADLSFSLDVTLGWARTEAWAVDPTAAARVEIIPTRAFLQHIRAHLEDAPAGGTADMVFEAIMAGATDSTPWSNDLKVRLAGLGFGAPVGGTPLDHSVREFQISAAGANVATLIDPATTPAQVALRQFADLRRADNDDRYVGPISGRPNQRTRELLQTWSRLGYRSPLIIGAFDAGQLDANGRPTAGPLTGHADLWGREDLTDEGPRVFAADFARSGLATDRIGLSDLDAIGTYATFAWHDGPGSLEPGKSGEHPVATAEITPMKLLGMTEAAVLTPVGDPSDEALRRRRLSTFKVTRAVAEQECMGYLDRANAYDGAGISVGACHWAMAGAVGKPKGTTELGGLAAYLAYLERDQGLAGSDIFSPQGLAVVTSDALEDVVSKHAGNGTFLAQLGFQDDRGRAVAMTPDGPKEYLPSWRSFYRWVQLGRTSASFGLANWHTLRRRLRLLLSASFSVDPLPTDSRQASARPTIGSVFTSEIAIAQILRWHVKIPGDVLGATGASRQLASVYAAAARTQPGNAQAWEDQLMAALLAHVDAVAPADDRYATMPAQFRDIADPAWTRPGGLNPRRYGLDVRLRNLSGDAGSFTFAGDIPEPPVES